MLCCSLKVEFNFSLCLSDKQVDLILCCFLYFIYLKTYWSQLKEMRQKVMRLEENDLDHTVKTTFKER